MQEAIKQNVAKGIKVVLETKMPQPREFKMLSTRLPVEIHACLAVASSASGLGIGEICEQAIRAWLAKYVEAEGAGC